MAQYRTKCLWQAGGGSPLPVGSVVELTDAEAAGHLAQRTIEAVKAPEPTPAAAPETDAPKMALTGKPRG